MEDKINLRSTYQSYALSAAAFLGAGIVLRMLASLAFNQFTSPEVYEKWNVTFSFINDLVCLYLVSFGLFLFLNRKAQKVTPEQNRISAGKFLLYVLILFGINGFGAFIGSFVNGLVVRMIGVSAGSAQVTQSMALNSSVILRMVVFGLVAPFVEEIVFRKVLIDRTLKYGEWCAIFVSAFMYALFQGSFSLFFYALLMGGLLAYIYIRTGKAWVVIALHTIMNLFNYVLTFFMQRFANAESLNEIELLKEEYENTGNAALLAQAEEIGERIKPQLVVYTVWSYVVGGICLVGLIVWVVLLIRKKFKLEYTENEVYKGQRFAIGNIGMLVYIVCAIALFVINYFRLSMG